MSTALDPSLRNLTACGCCQGVAVSTPVRIENRPGLSALACRVGTHARFKQTLLARLSATNYPALRDLTTREDADFTIGLLDAWSVAADVLTFYQERLANEAYLRTATERLSVLEQARLIGYQLDPGVAASAYLAIEVESTAGAFGQALATGNSIQAPMQPPPPVTVEAGLKVQSIPGPDEKPQVFETIEAIEARAEWNAMKPRQTRLHLPADEDTHLYLQGVTTNLQEGSAMIIVGLERMEDSENDNWEFRRVTKVETDADANRTKISFERPLGSNLPPSLPPQKCPKVYALRLRTALFGHNAPDWKTLPVALRIGEINPQTGRFNKGAFADGEHKWANHEFPNDQRWIDLDAVYPQIAVGSWIVLSSVRYAELYQVTAVAEASCAKFTISGKATRLTIDGEHLDKFSPRSGSVFAQSEELELAETPIRDPVQGKQIELDGRFDDLPDGRLLIVKGKRMRLQIQPDAESLKLVSDTDSSKTASLAPGDELIVLEPAVTVEDGSGEKLWRLEDEGGFQGALTVADQFVALVSAHDDDEDVVETAVVQRVVEADKTHSTIMLSGNLANVYDPTTVRIFANVAPATHGETVEETLGNGDGSQAFQRFTLKQSPVTHVTASTPSGSRSTLEVRVNNVLWEEVPSFHGREPQDRVYVTQLTDDGKTTVVFGDGVQGARLPTGVENVTAKYRKGIGLGGLVKAGQSSQLMTRPLGVKSAVNPLASAGAEDPDTLDQARRNAPITVLTLDRIVSLQDYEDFARNFAGVEKALATWVWFGETRGVFLTVAGPKGAEISETSVTHENLVAAITKYGDPNVPFVVSSYQPRFFRIQGSVRLESDYLVEVVAPLIEEALRERFSFEERGFGQAVALSEIVAVIHGVEGVAWVDVDALACSDASDQADANTEEAAVCPSILAARVPSADDKTPQPAELLTLDPRPLGLEVSL